MSQIPKSETPAELLARSLFGFALLAWLAWLITWVGLWLSPPSPSPTYERIRVGLIVGFGWLALAGFWGVMRLFRTAPDHLLPISERLTRWLQRPWLSWLFCLAILEANLIVFLATPYVAPAILGPIRFLMVCWSGLFVGMLVAIHRAALAGWFGRTRGLWMSLGVSVVGIGALALAFFINSLWVEAVGLNAALRGGLDARPLTFYEDGQPEPTAQDFWLEQAQTRVRWSPYTYWVVDAFAGDFINVGADGLRETPQDSQNATKTAFVFGGSTVWGEGARDAYTIPGHMARLLDEVQVVNYGQTGYVSTQDMLWFQLQLLNGRVPDVAVFYQGFNDVLASCDPVILSAQQRCADGLVGVTLQENFRLADSEAGRILRGGQPVFRPPSIPLDQYDFSSAGVVAATPQAVVARWFANIEMIEALAAAHDVETLFVWQPMLIEKTPLTDAEGAIVELVARDRAGLFERYAQVTQLVRERCRAACDNILLLDDLFANDDRTIFHDLVHITEEGNAAVAAAIAPAVQNLLDD